MSFREPHFLQLIVGPRHLRSRQEARPAKAQEHSPSRRGSAPLSHLFSQALVSVQTLANSPDSRAEFTAKGRDHPMGRNLPADFVPKKVIFGILLKHGEPLTTDTLFPFSQVTLAHTATELQARHQVTVEVIGIDADAP